MAGFNLLSCEPSVLSDVFREQSRGSKAAAPFDSGYQIAGCEYGLLASETE